MSLLSRAHDHSDSLPNLQPLPPDQLGKTLSCRPADLPPAIQVWAEIERQFQLASDLGTQRRKHVDDYLGAVEENGRANKESDKVIEVSAGVTELGSA